MDYDKVGAKRVSDMIRKSVISAIENNNFDKEGMLPLHWIRSELGRGDDPLFEPHIDQNYIRQIARRQIERMGAQAKASVRKGNDPEHGDCYYVSLIHCEDVIPKGKLFKEEWLDEFEVNVEALGDSEMSVRDLNEIVRQLKAFAIEKMNQR